MDRRRNPLRDPAPFRVWLEEQPSSRTVGWPGRSKECPLANYVRAERGPETFVSIPDLESFVVDNQLFRVPGWAERFIELADRCRGEIWAGRAQSLLEQAEAGGA